MLIDGNWGMRRSRDAMTTILTFIPVIVDWMHFFLFRSKVYQTLFFIFIFPTLAFRCRVWLSTFPYFRQIKSNYCAFFDHLNFPLLYRLPLKRCYNDVLLEWLMSSPLLSFSFERTHKNENSDFFIRLFLYVVSARCYVNYNAPTLRNTRTIHRKSQHAIVYCRYVEFVLSNKKKY